MYGTSDYLLNDVALHRNSSTFEIGRVGNDLAHAKCNDSSKERDNSSLNLKQGEIAKDDGSALLGDVEITHVGSGTKTCRQIHLKVSFQVEDNGDEHDQLVYASHSFPMLCLAVINRYGQLEDVDSGTHRDRLQDLSSE